MKAKTEVAADLIESTPGSHALAYWVLASPMLLFLAWIWIDLFAHYSPVPWFWLDAILGIILFLVIVVLPAGIAAHWIVTALPRLFQNAGWEVQPLEPVSPAEQYQVRYVFRSRRRAANSWRRAWLRAAQGWVYLEIAAILIGGVLMVPLFMSVTEFGFGQ
jgi:hypothetical protein